MRFTSADAPTTPENGVTMGKRSRAECKDACVASAGTVSKGLKSAQVHEPASLVAVSKEHKGIRIAIFTTAVVATLFSWFNHHGQALDITPIMVDDKTVFVVENFFPESLAQRWQASLLSAWYYSELLRAWDDSEHGGFLYTTNNDGEVRGQEETAKVRGNHNVSLRQAAAEQMRKSGAFSYSKWELDQTHPIAAEMRRYFESDSTRKRIAAAVGASPLTKVLTDLFVTRYGAGDFLSAHNDGVSGSWAFVISLSNPELAWHTDFGGLLRFHCDGDAATAPLLQWWCVDLPPKFNSAAFFRTTPSGPRSGPVHTVEEVQPSADSAGWHRFGITGWYSEVSDG